MTNRLINRLVDNTKDLYSKFQDDPGCEGLYADFELSHAERQLTVSGSTKALSISLPVSPSVARASWSFGSRPYLAIWICQIASRSGWLAETGLSTHLKKVQTGETCGMREQRKPVTRQELYEKVWTTPIVRLAEELGYSYPELITIMTTLSIPRPSGGYWYRLQRGGASEQVPLPPAPEGAKTEIPLGPRLSALLPPSPPTHVGPSDETTARAPAPTKQPKRTAKQEPGGAPEVAASATAEAPTQAETSAQPAKLAAPARVAPKFPDPTTIPVGGPYPEMWRLKPHDFRNQQPKPEPSPYSQYHGYSRY